MLLGIGIGTAVETARALFALTHEASQRKILTHFLVWHGNPFAVEHVLHRDEKFF
jgi:hypothetical protein